MPLGARPPSKCEQNIVTNFMYTLDAILDDSSMFQNKLFISFSQFVYCSRVRLQVSSKG